MSEINVVIDGLPAENPNEYDDEMFTNASNELIGGIGGMWEAGAAKSEIETAVRDALSEYAG